MVYKQTFYIVLIEGRMGKDSFYTWKTDRIPDRKEAEQEAKRLCEIWKTECVVLESVYSVELSKFIEHQYDAIPG